MSEIVIRAEGLGKRYRIGTAAPRIKTARDVLPYLLGAPLRNLDRLRRLSQFAEGEESDTIWALRDASFELAEGEVLGIVGHNGAGKSTLLKILSRIIRQTTGRVEMCGRVGSLLEVGTGFHPELTGRDNVYLNGSILGMDKRYIDRRFDEILEFSGVEKFIDTPVKRYSSGMKVRLAFAVAAHLEPEILIVDEVLAVGDAQFQKKCLGKMTQVAGEGRTVLFVSHNLVAVQALCSRALWLDGGRIEMDGPVSQVVARYLEKTVSTTTCVSWSAGMSPASESESARMLWVRVRPEHGEPGNLIDVRSPFLVEFAFQPLVDMPVLRPRLHLVNQERIVVFKSGPHTPASPTTGAEIRYACRVPGDLLNNGQYTVNLLLFDENDTIALRMDDVLNFEIADAPAMRGHWFGEWGGIVRPALEWHAETYTDTALADRAVADDRRMPHLAVK